MARTRNNKFIGMAAHAQRLDDRRMIDYQNHLARKRAEQDDVALEWKIMQGCANVFGDLFIQWYDSPAVPTHGTARDRIARIRAWAREQLRIAHSITPQMEEEMGIVHELVKVSEYADAQTSYDQPDPHAVIESYLIDRQITDAWADIPEIEL